MTESTQPAAARRAPAGERLRQAALSVGVGLVVGLIVVGVMISLGALIFAGPLAPFLPNGIGLVLAGTSVIAAGVALLSARPAVIASVQDTTAVVLAVIAAGIAAAMEGAPAEAVYGTVVAAIVVTSLASGAAFVLLGHFRLGSLARFLPYPVIGGFLGGTGWLLLAGGVGVMAGVQPGLATLSALLAPDVLPRWLPGVALGAGMLLVMRRARHPLALLGLIAAAAAAYYLWLGLAGIPAGEALRRGWLLGPFPERALWAPVSPALLAAARWEPIAGQAGAIATAVVIGIVSLLLNVSGLQVALREDMDLNRELRAAGGAQLAAGLVGGPPGFHGLSLVMLGHQLGARTRLVGLAVGAVSALAVLFGAGAIALFPRAVLGGIIVFLGLGFLAEWLYDSWKLLPRQDYATVVAIVALIAAFGILPGVVAGLVLAVILFAVTYSRIDVVKHALSGATARSRVTRSHAEQLLLRELGEQIAVFQLQGFIFFGTAHELYERVRRRARAAELPRLRFVLLDFRLVPRLDSTALLSFSKLVQLAEADGLALVFTQLAPAVRRQIERGLPASGSQVRIFPDQDYGLGWCEDQLLAAAWPPVGADDLRALLARLAPEGADIDAMLGYFERRPFRPGDYLMRRGEEPEDMLLVDTGQVTAQIVQPDGTALRLETVRGGRAVGELGFFLGTPRTADVVADEPGTSYRITRASLERLERERPAEAAALHLIIARLLSERVVHLIGTVDALQK